METLRIYRQDGTLLESVDLATAQGRILTIGSSSQATLSLASHLRKGEELFAPIALALVQDEDGWILATADAVESLHVGNESFTDVRMIPRTAYRFGPFVFRLERDVTEAEAMLVWRCYGSSEIHCDPLNEGRNSVVQLHESEMLAVNPATADEVLFDVIFEREELSVLAGNGSERLNVHLGEQFSVGPFVGIVLTSADARNAMNTRAPLAWPNRRVARHLKFYGLGAMAVLVLLLMVGVWTQQVRETVAKNRIACREFPEQGKLAIDDEKDHTLDDDLLAYNLVFHRSLAALLMPEKLTITPYLIARGKRLLARCEATEEKKERRQAITRKIHFLSDLVSLKDAIVAERWSLLHERMETIDKETFFYYDGKDFLADAMEIANFLTVMIPSFYAAASERGTSAFLDADHRLTEAFDGLSNNRFFSPEIAARQRAIALQRWHILRTYVSAREAVLATTAQTPLPLDALQDAFLMLEANLDPEDKAQAALLERERQLIGAFAAQQVQAQLARKESSAARPSELLHLCTLATAVGCPVPDAERVKAKAEAMERTFTRQWRALHEHYRLQRMAKDSQAEKTLAEMIALGPSDSPFYMWALREQACRQKNASAEAEIEPLRVPTEKDGAQ